MIEPLLYLLLGIAIIIMIIAVGGYFVAQEFAYMAVDRTKLAAQAAQGDKAAERALLVTKQTSFMLSGAQLGITVTGLMVGYVAEPLVGGALGTMLGGVGIPTEVGIATGTILALLFATLVQMIFGELYPKNLAISNAETLAKMLATSTLLYLKVMGWIISFFDMSANALLKMLRIEPIHDIDVSASREDLPRIIADSRNSGDLPAELAWMMDRIVDFPERDVEHAMVPRSQVDWIGPEASIAEVREMMARAHTRYPVVDDEETPIGVVHLSDLLPHLETADPNASVTTIMRPALVVPTLMNLPDAFDKLVDTNNQLACVIDEYGGFAGVLTLEDIAMEIVGEITDEHDSDEEDAVTVDGDGVWIMEGDVHLDEVERTIGRPIEKGDVETIAGLLIAETGELPAVDEVVIVSLPADQAEIAEDIKINRSLSVTVLEVERHVPTRVRVQLIEQAE
jgi:CBS domain containing-hemolysin-like protein